MRERRFIKESSPCDTDMADKTIQTVADAVAKGRTWCSNREQCEKRSVAENIMCYRTTAKEMAGFILDRKSPFGQAVREEKEEYLGGAPDGKFWVCRDGQWQVIEGKKNVVNDIVEFAILIIDMKPGDRRPFTKDGTRTPELGPSDATHNAMLDLDDIYAEVGQKNPFRSSRSQR